MRARPDELFAHADDHTRLASHMSRSSLALVAARMTVELDEGRGRVVGSRIRLQGRLFGLRLFVEEVVTERDPPHRKVWETIGRPRLGVIGHYRMGFDIIPQSGGSLLCVFIDYAWSDTAPASWLGRLLGGTYARWCTRRMAEDAVARFSSRPELATR